MSPRQFHHHHHHTESSTPAAAPLKINKDSHFIKKSSSPPSSSSTLGSSKQPHRHPVIIYTHSPKVIHTHPKDFMALVQKLTGLSRADDDQSPPHQNKSKDDDQESVVVKMSNDDNESGSSVITTEENYVEGQVNSCLVSTPIFDPPQFMPVYSAEFFCPPFYNYGDSFFYSQNMNMRSSPGFDAINEFRDY